jgi:hypothetical protein
MTVNHGIMPRDLTLPTFPSGPQLFDDRFGRLFPFLPSFEPADADLEDLAKTVIEKATDVEEADKPSNVHQPDTGLAAGFTYLGQFIDHDLTFDPVSQLGVKTDPNALHDFRTPRFLTWTASTAPDPTTRCFSTTSRIASTCCSTPPTTTCSAIQKALPSSVTRATMKTASSRTCS